MEVVESLALRMALQWAIEQGWCIAWSHMDCLEIVNLFNFSSFEYSSVGSILDDFRHLSFSFDSFRLLFVLEIVMDLQMNLLGVWFEDEIDL